MFSTWFSNCSISFGGFVGVSTVTSPGSSPPSNSAAATGTPIAPTAPGMFTSSAMFAQFSTQPSNHKLKGRPLRCAGDCNSHRKSVEAGDSRPFFVAFNEVGPYRAVNVLCWFNSFVNLKNIIKYGFIHIQRF